LIAFYELYSLFRKSDDSSLPLNLKEVREVAETAAIKRALVHSDNNVSNTAKLLGVTRPTLYTLLNKYGLAVKDGIE